MEGPQRTAVIPQAVTGASTRLGFDPGGPTTQPKGCRSAARCCPATAPILLTSMTPRAGEPGDVRVGGRTSSNAATVLAVPHGPARRSLRSLCGVLVLGSDDLTFHRDQRLSQPEPALRCLAVNQRAANGVVRLALGETPQTGQHRLRLVSVKQ